MRKTDWESRWHEGRIGFNQPTVSPMLERYADRVWGSAGPRRVLVPLCGKSLDMVFLAGRGATVVGVEYVERGVREFFAERGAVPEEDRGPPASFTNGAYRLFAADFFDVAAEHFGEVDGVHDRAALIALDGPTRARYAAHLGEQLAPGARMLLITLEYDQSEMPGPPFAVLRDEVEALFGVEFEIEPLDSRDISEPRFRDQGVTAMREVAYALTLRVP